MFRFSLRFAEQTDYQFEKCTEWLPSAHAHMTDSLKKFSLHYCYVKITIFHPRVSKIKLRFYLKPGNREPMFECWDESGSEHPDMVPHRGIVDIDIFQMSIYRTSICHIDQG